MRVLTKFILVFILIVGPSAISMSQNLQFQRFDEAFPSRPVSNFLMDHNGFLWIATYGAGLYRYDGNDYKPFLFDWKDTTSINSNFLSGIHLDRSNRLWVGTDAGLNLYNNENRNFNRIVFKDANGTRLNLSILSICEDNSDNLLVGTFRNGVVRLKLDSVFDQYMLAESSQQVLSVNQLVKGVNGGIYAATNQGLKTYSSKENTLVDPSFSNTLLSQPAQSLFYEKNTLWIGTLMDGLIKVSDVESDKPDIIQYGCTSERIMSIVKWNGTITCATENDGLIMLDLKKGEIKEYQNKVYDKRSIESNSIWSMLVDSEERLWLGYYNKGIGLMDFQYNKFESLSHEFNNNNSFSSSSVNGILEQGDSVIWIGMDGGGVDKYYPKLNKVVHLNSKNGFLGLDDLSVQTIFLDSKSNLWVGTWGGGIYLLKKGSRFFQNFSKENTKGLKSNRILKFSEDGFGNIWIATFGSGLHVFSSKEGIVSQLRTKDIIQNRIHQSDIRDILVDFEGTIWIGSTTGIYKLKLSSSDTAIFYVADSEQILHPNFNYALSLCEDANHNVWIGTDGAGLFMVDNHKDSIIRLNESLEITQKTICGIVEDQMGNIWISGKSGISRIDTGSSQVFNYTKNDGLLSDDFNYGAIASFSNGKVHFGSQEGLNSIHPESLKFDEKEIPVYLDELRLFNRPVSPNTSNSPLAQSLELTNEITLDFTQSVFSIEYTGVSFTRPEKIQFSYFLEGLEDSWNYVGRQRSATYTSLKPGSYVFHVRAAKNDGAWSGETQLKINVLPAWYRSNWALAIYIFLFFIGLLLLNFLFRARLREKQEVLNERDRSKQNVELTQRKLQFFTNISHEFRTPLTLILNPLAQLVKMGDLPSSAGRYLNTVQRNARRLERLIDELMDFRKLNSGKLKIHIHKIDLLAFTKEIANYFDQEAFQNEVELEVHGDLESHYAWVDSGLVEKILFNLLSNAFKVTPEKGIISISLKEVRTHLPLIDQEETEVLQLSVSDTGSGLSSDHLNKIFERFYQVESMDQGYFSGTGIGLEVVKSFIELHKGKVEVESKEGQGTTFQLYFPLGKDHFSEDDLVVGEYPGKREFLESKGDSGKSHFKQEFSEDFKKKTILVVDDNPELRKFVKSELQDAYQVELAKSGEEGLEMALHHLPEIIITDVMMPGMNGFEFCKKVKSDLKTSHIPLIMLTAKSTPEERISGIETGADAYITKPFDMTLLKTQINQIVKSRQLLFEKYLKDIGQVEVLEENTTVDRDFIQSIITYIHSNIGDTQLSVENIADEVSLSRSQLYRKVKALTGLNVNEFVRRIRLEQARKYLGQGGMNVNQVCFKVGFSSPSYFSKCYKEYFGILPTDERKVN